MKSQEYPPTPHPRICQLTIIIDSIQFLKKKSWSGTNRYWSEIKVYLKSRTAHLHQELLEICTREKIEGILWTGPAFNDKPVNNKVNH